MNIQKILAKIDETSDYLVWGMATISLFGSLYFSEVLNYPPCMLCWWQRILIYPLVIIMSVSILRKDKNVAYTVLPFAVIGSIVAFYHSLLQWGVINETILDCTVNAAVSCSDAEINWFGFVTIPFLSFLAFAGVTVLMSLRIWFIRKQAK